MNGHSANPFQEVEGQSDISGAAVGQQPPPNLLDSDRRYVRGYMKSLRGCDKAMKALFNDIIVEDPEGKAHNVPLIWGSQEKALLAAFGETMRRDGSGEITRVVLPIISLLGQDPQFSVERYTYSEALNWFDPLGGAFGQESTPKDVRYAKSRGLPIDRSYILRVWSKYWEDLNQILEQIILKFNPVAYIEVEGVEWEIIVKLDSIGSNLDDSPGDSAIRILKYEIVMTAETYVVQPTVRERTVLSQNTEWRLNDPHGHVEKTEDINVEANT